MFFFSVQEIFQRWNVRKYFERFPNSSFEYALPIESYKLDFFDWKMRIRKFLGILQNFRVKLKPTK